MAITIPIISEFADKGIVAAEASFKNFRAKVGEAEGAMGKFKAGGSAAMDAIKANAGAMAMAAGTAIATFAVKAIGEFQNLALEVGKFADASGLAAEDASRWVEVAGDIGVQSNTLMGAFNRLNRAVGDNSKAFEELGVEIVRTTDGATDVNATFLDTIDALKNVKDPAQRARLATQLLGRSWTELSELVEMGATDLSMALESVSDARVIDESEIEKAKEFREAQQELAEAFQDFTLAIGEALLPALNRLLPMITAIATAGGEVIDAIGGGDGVTAEMLEMGITIDEIVRNANNPQDGIEMVMRDLGMTFEEVADVISDDLLPANYRLNKIWEEGYAAMSDAATGAQELGETLEMVDDALSELKENIDERQAWRNLQDTIDDVKEAVWKAFTEATPQALRDSEDALDRARLKVGEYVTDLDDIPETQRTEIIAALDTANLEEIEDFLNYLARTREVPFMPTVRPGAGGISEIGPGGRPIGSVPIANPFAPAATRSAMNVQVNVAGSVISERDLVENVRKGLIDAQRNGSALVYTGP